MSHHNTFSKQKNTPQNTSTNIPLKFLNACIGSVKDSVVGEERIVIYLLAVLNTRGTPLHWNHLNKRRLEGIQFDSEEKHEYKIKDLRPQRRKLPNNSDMIYVEVICDPSHLFIFFMEDGKSI